MINVILFRHWERNFLLEMLMNISKLNISFLKVNELMYNKIFPKNILGNMEGL
jgi:hypothetical protein